MRKIVVLGSTGSIGRQALDVIEESPELAVVGLAASSSYELIAEQARRFSVDQVALTDAQAAIKLAGSWPEGDVLSGPDGLSKLISCSDADIVLNSIVGAAGLMPTVVSLTEGKDLALANKESLVIGGDLVTQLAEAKGAQIIPVDSEHSALFQLIRGERTSDNPGTVKKLVLTASGGPFRGFSRDQLNDISPSQALSHPTWEMGGKITVDSATLMNKGLELIEAQHLFGLPTDRIEVVVHTQSIVHGMIHLIDGSSIAHLGTPDMRVPISYALHYPSRADLPLETLDLSKTGELTFEEPDSKTFGCLDLAKRAARDRGTLPCTMNAANEIAVGLFLEDRLPFLEIERVIAETMEIYPSSPVDSFESLYAADAEARTAASGLADRYQKVKNGVSD